MLLESERKRTGEEMGEKVEREREKKKTSAVSVPKVSGTGHTTRQAYPISASAERVSAAE